MSPEQTHGVVFPADQEGRRSTAALGRAVLAEALRAVDHPGALAVEQETNWRTGYLVHFRRAVEAGVESREAALRIATDGLHAVNDRMRVLGEHGESRLADWSSATELGRVEVTGAAAPEPELSVPFHGTRLRGDALHRQLDTWVAAGILEPSVAEVVRSVMENPDWLRAEGHTIAVLGAGAEMGPLQALMRWGARVAAVDLPNPQIWTRVLDTARGSAGTLLLPVPAGVGEADPTNIGVDLIADGPSVARWLVELDGSLTVGNYVYADGATNVRVSVAVDELSRRVLNERSDAALAFLATPTDVFAVPADAVRQSTQAYESRSGTAKLLGRPLRAVSAGRLLRRSYAPTADPGINDSLVPQQGPNYALAKRLQRWRATVARDAGTLVSLHVAPPTRTRSVVKNRALAAAYAGAHRFGVEVFEPATSNVLMAAMLVHDLHTAGGPAHEHPWQDEAYAAAHGGLWRAPYAPRSALGLAALLGYAAARS